MSTTGTAPRPKTFVRFLKIAGIAILAIVLLALAILYGGSEWTLRRAHDVELVPLGVPVTPARAQEGARLAAAFGCRDCHMADGQGRVIVDDPLFGQVVAPGIAWAAADYSDAELARLIRHGVRKDGTGVIVMPSTTYVNMADEDVAAIVAWVRTLKPGPNEVARRSSFGPLGRGLILGGVVPLQVVRSTRHSPVRRPADIGEYYYDAACSDCHALDRERPAHVGPRPAPALAVAGGAYDLPAFRRMLRTGKAPDGRDLGLMGQVARSAGPALTDAEIAAIHAFLRRKADALPAE